MKRFIYLSTLLLLSVGCSKDESASNASGSGVGGSTAKFTISDDHLFILNSGATLRSYDVSTSEDPVFEEETHLNSWFMETIFPREGYLFFGSQQGVYIYQIQNEGTIEYVSSIQHIFSCDPVVADDEYAFATLNSVRTSCLGQENLLEVYDIKNIYKPKRIAQYEMQAPLGLGISDSLLFVCDDGLKVFNRKNPLALKQLQKFEIAANDVIPYHDHLIVIANEGLFQYKIEGDGLVELSNIKMELASGQ